MLAVEKQMFLRRAGVATQLRDGDGLAKTLGRDHTCAQRERYLSKQLQGSGSKWG
jgi:hypothetical protein